MIRTATITVRAATVILVPVLVLTGHPPAGATLAAHVVAMVVGAGAVAAYGVLSWRTTDEPGWTAGTLIVMAVAAAPATTHHGGPLITFALLAAVSAGSLRQLAVGWSVTGAAVLAIVGGGIVTRASVPAVVGYCLVVVVALLVGHDRRAYRMQARQAAALATQAEILRSDQARTATLAERARIAREIHDVLAHSLGALGIQIQAARALLSDADDPDRALAVLDRAQRIATEGLDETRRAVHVLRTDSQPLSEELGMLARAHGDTFGVLVTCCIEGGARPLPPEAHLALLRTAQESLVNAAKHAPGQPIVVELSDDADSTRLRVSNPAQGHQGTPGLRTVDAGYGLMGLRERLLLLRGTLTAGDSDGQWAVTAQVPR